MRRVFAEAIHGFSAALCVLCASAVIDFRRNRKTLKLWGPGYRVYYAQAGQRLILLLAGGDKRKQRADMLAVLGAAGLQLAVARPQQTA